MSYWSGRAPTECSAEARRERGLQEAAFLASKNGPVAGPCDPAAKAAPAGATAKSCASTLVGGLPGTGLEGGACNVDINECVRGTDNCAVNATCINTNGGFQCKCWVGFAGTWVPVLMTS